jgi:predicted DNA-binding transcriptional regulator|tara:strand:- start:5823 stop:6395 length:573 start_codon:yes stop_codon:yes gene_type:complete
MKKESTIKDSSGEFESIPVEKEKPSSETEIKSKPKNPVEKTEIKSDEIDNSEEEDELLDFTSRVYKLVVEHGKEGVLQSELWKKLNLTSRDGSRLAIRLEKRGMIKREKILEGGRWTYELSPLRLPAQIKSIEESPCITCPEELKCSTDSEVSPHICYYLAEWAIREYLKFQNITATPEVIYERMFTMKA